MTAPYQKLTTQEEYIILRKGTEAPFSGKYNDHWEGGVYSCRQCGTKLYKSKDKFHSNCGWPSFDDEILGAVKKYPMLTVCAPRLSAKIVADIWVMSSLERA